MSEDGRRGGTMSRLSIAALSALIGFGAVYVTLGRPDNNAARAPAAPAPAPPKAEAAASGSSSPAGAPAAAAKLNTGHMTAFVYKPAPEALAEVNFNDAEGKSRTLADWKGRTVLLNLWATWCAPCRKEMPALDRLQKQLGSDKFEVVALSVDRAGVDAARKFLAETKVEALKLYIDPTARATTALKAVGMPTTILIGPDGLEIGRLVGPAEWDSEDAVRLVKSAIR